MIITYESVCGVFTQGLNDYTKNLRFCPSKHRFGSYSYSSFRSKKTQYVYTRRQWQEAPSSRNLVVMIRC